MSACHAGQLSVLGGEYSNYLCQFHRREKTKQMVTSLSSALKRKTPATPSPASRSVLFASPPSPLTFRIREELPRIPSVLTPSPFFATPEFQKPKLLVNSLGHKTTAPTKAQLRAAAARERWEQAAEQRALQHQTGALNMSESENVRIHFLSNPENVRIGKRQNLKTSEFELVRI